MDINEKNTSHIFKIDNIKYREFLIKDEKEPDKNKYGFTEEKIINRINFLIEKITAFKNQCNFEVDIDFNLLELAVLDYFTDMYRLKQFHRIETASPLKVDSYMSYWFLRRHPLYCIRKNKNLEKEDASIYINEKFIYTLLWERIVSECKFDIKSDLDKEVDNFSNFLFYFLRYRDVTPQSIELMLTTAISVNNINTIINKRNNPK